jgi:hypothetical protein
VWRLFVLLYAHHSLSSPLCWCVSITLPASAVGTSFLRCNQQCMFTKYAREKINAASIFERSDET